MKNDIYVGYQNEYGKAGKKYESDFCAMNALIFPSSKLIQVYCSKIAKVRI